MKHHYYLLFMLALTSCAQSSKSDKLANSNQNVTNLISSNEPGKLVEAFYLVGENKMIDYVPIIFEKIDDPRISHNAKFKGISVYQSKIIALEKISGIESPRNVTYKPDTVIIKFYRNWAFDRGYIKK
jgi:hypothetical protein